VGSSLRISALLAALASDSHRQASSSVLCVFITAVPITKLFVVLDAINVSRACLFTMNE
jgi:hypothetical protein